MGTIYLIYILTRGLIRFPVVQTMSAEYFEVMLFQYNVIHSVFDGVGLTDFKSRANAFLLA